MSTALINIDLNKLQAAIDVEIKYQYIDIRGNHCSFSAYIKDELKKIYKNSKKAPQWSTLIEAFSRYPMETMLVRKKMIDRLIKCLREELTKKDKPNGDKKE